MQDEGPLVLRSSTASQEQIEAFSTLSSAEHYFFISTEKKQIYKRKEKNKKIKTYFLIKFYRIINGSKTIKESLNFIQLAFILRRFHAVIDNGKYFLNK